MLPGPRPLRVLPLLLCLLLCLLAGCGGRPAADAAEREVRAAVASWSRSVPAQLAQIPLEDWAYEVTSVRRDGVRAHVRAQLSYRLAGYDQAPGGSERALELDRDGGSWRVRSDRPAPGALPQLWDQGPVSVVRGAHALVLGSADGPTLTAVAAEADRAVPEASGAWPRPWAGRVVVLVPGSLDRMAQLLGRPADTYRGLGAVTTGRVDGGSGPADRVVINPEGYAGLSEAGRGIVLVHEVTHVATRAATTATTPQWLSEGFADWAAYRGSSSTPQQAAPALTRAVRRGELPAELPPAQAFAFGAEPEAVARAYEGAWLACRLIAGRWGEAALVDLYERAGRAPWPTALDEALGVDPAELTRAWQEALRTELGS
ncbi:hypothetical protein OG264_11820 [Streptomyces xanthophaeus]|uniref:hypothetical protein n=1 Tax=Streptomyces xanthophaeus TaxID=67385 RepID=UPI003868280C|nr:hypothetical protein OG264_11820 [Streptomyces xanthophaeus]WST62908.1 hypothetical protein OG605_26615 [Streptomyces xanthophaeus]